MEQSSHTGVDLSAWTASGITGYNLFEIILKSSGQNYTYIIFTAMGLYFVALIICVAMVKEGKDAEEIKMHK